MSEISESVLVPDMTQPLTYVWLGCQTSAVGWDINFWMAGKSTAVKCKTTWLSLGGLINVHNLSTALRHTSSYVVFPWSYIYKELRLRSTQMHIQSALTVCYQFIPIWTRYYLLSSHGPRHRYFRDPTSVSSVAVAGEISRVAGALLGIHIPRGSSAAQRRGQSPVIVDQHHNTAT